MPLIADFYHVLYGVFSVRACFASDSAFPNIASLFLSTGCLLIRRVWLTLLPYFFHAVIIPHLTYKDKFQFTFYLVRKHTSKQKYSAWSRPSILSH